MTSEKTITSEKTMTSEATDEDTSVEALPADVLPVEAASHDRPPLPDRLSTNPSSAFYDASILERDIGIRFKGVEKTNVEEYCVSESWVRLSVGAAKDRAGNPMTIKLSGPVEPYFRTRA